MSPSARRAAEILAEAGELNLSTPGRRGDVVWIEEGEVIVVGDLHGAHRNYGRILRAVDLPAHPDRHIVFQETIHGTSVTRDGRDTSFQLLEMVAHLKAMFPEQVHIILGNHDINELLRLEVEKGGEKSLLAFERALASAYGEGKAIVRRAYNKFFRSLPLVVRTRGGLFISHSIPSRRHHHIYTSAMLEGEESFGEYAPGSPAYWLVWGRDLSSECISAFNEKAMASLFVVGHFPCEDGYNIPHHNLLILDCKDEYGCYAVFYADRAVEPAELVSCIRRVHPELAQPSE